MALASIGVSAYFKIVKKDDRGGVMMSGQEPVMDKSIIWVNAYSELPRALKG